jgi:POT family proton-dependent oligopeptide transporter
MVNLCGSVLSTLFLANGSKSRCSFLGFKNAGGISFVYIVYYAITHLDGKARHQLMALTILCFTIVFWALFEQAYTSMNLFADRIFRTVFGYEVSAGQFLSFNALFIILLAQFSLGYGPIWKI